MRDIGGSYLYEWIVKPAVGHSGGMLVAIRKDFSKWKIASSESSLLVRLSKKLRVVSDGKSLTFMGRRQLSKKMSFLLK